MAKNNDNSIVVLLIEAKYSPVDFLVARAVDAYEEKLRGRRSIFLHYWWLKLGLERDRARGPENAFVIIRFASGRVIFNLQWPPQ